MVHFCCVMHSFYVAACRTLSSLLFQISVQPLSAHTASDGEDRAELLATHCPETQSMVCGAGWVGGREGVVWAFHVCMYVALNCVTCACEWVLICIHFVYVCACLPIYVYSTSLPSPLLQDNKEQPGLYDESDSEDDEPGMSLHGGLSTMRMLLGANDRRIYSQRFGMAHYDTALQREKQRMVCMCMHPTQSCVDSHHSVYVRFSQYNLRHIFCFHANHDIIKCHKAGSIIIVMTISIIIYLVTFSCNMHNMIIIYTVEHTELIWCSIGGVNSYYVHAVILFVY